MTLEDRRLPAPYQPLGPPVPAPTPKPFRVDPLHEAWTTRNLTPDGASKLGSVPAQKPKSTEPFRRPEKIHTADWYDRAKNPKARVLRPETIARREPYYAAKLVAGMLDRGPLPKSSDDDSILRPQTLGGTPTYSYSDSEFTDALLYHNGHLGEPLPVLQEDTEATVEALTEALSVACGLLPQQRLVLRWILDGGELTGQYSDRLGAYLGVKPSTARWHLHNTLKALRGKAELVNSILTGEI